MELLELARGPGLALSIIVFVLGLAWRLYRIFRRPARVDHSEPRRRDLAAGGVRAVFAKMLPPKGVRIRGLEVVRQIATLRGRPKSRAMRELSTAIRLEFDGFISAGLMRSPKARAHR